jgi:hypothetical protein
MKLVNEDKYGAYSGVRAKFLEKFILKESNPNFEVYDAKDGNNRLIVVKASRLPDDEDLSAGRYGINFHRAKPEYEAAKSFYEDLAKAKTNLQTLNSLAFAALNREHYDRKADVWDKFYSFIWDKRPQNIWVTPHSGGIERAPDDIFPYPKLEMDAYVAGVAARCALQDNDPAVKRIMMSIHSLNWYSGVIDIGGFGVNDEKKLKATAAMVNDKYGDRAQGAAEGCRRDFAARLIPWLEHIMRTRGTLELRKLPPEYGIERSTIYCAMTGLKLYGREITQFTPGEFAAAVESLKSERVTVASCNHIYSGQQIGQQLELADQIQRGRMDGAVQIECMKFYLKHAPALVAEIILDVKHELFR